MEIVTTFTFFFKCIHIFHHRQNLCILGIGMASFFMTRVSSFINVVVKPNKEKLPYAHKFNFFLYLDRYIGTFFRIFFFEPRNSCSI